MAAARAPGSSSFTSKSVLTVHYDFGISAASECYDRKRVRHGRKHGAGQRFLVRGENEEIRRGIHAFDVGNKPRKFHGVFEVKLPRRVPADWLFHGLLRRGARRIAETARANRQKREAGARVLFPARMPRHCRGTSFLAESRNDCARLSRSDCEIIAGISTPTKITSTRSAGRPLSITDFSTKSDTATTRPAARYRARESEADDSGSSTRRETITGT